MVTALHYDTSKYEMDALKGEILKYERKFFILQESVMKHTVENVKKKNENIRVKRKLGVAPLERCSPLLILPPFLHQDH